MKVVLITNSFTPNRVPLWNAIGDLCDLTIIFLTSLEKVRKWDVSLHQLRARTLVIGMKNRIYIRSFDWALNLAVRPISKALTEICPDAVIIGGYENPGYWMALQWARRRQIPAVLWFGSTLLSTRTSGNIALDAIKRRFISSCHAYYAYGRYAGECLQYYGAPADRIIIGTNHTNDENFPSCERIGAFTSCRLLYVGQLIKRKGVIEMFEALSRITDLRWALTIAGDGELRPELDRIADRGGFADRIEWKEFVQQKHLSGIYRTADVLLMPSLLEVWGLVVNEGLLSGLYVIGSNRAAASLELITKHINGDIIAPEPEALESAVRVSIKLAPFNRSAIRNTIASVTATGEAKKLMAAIEVAANRSEHRSSVQVR